MTRIDWATHEQTAAAEHSLRTPDPGVAGVEDTVKQKGDYFRSVFESSPDIIVSVDRNRCITEFNQAAQRVFGYSVDEVRGQPVQLLYADQEQAHKVHRSVEASGSFHGTIINRTRDGRTFIACLEASQLRDDQGCVIGTMGVSRDITQQQQAEDRLRESEERFRVAQELSLDAFTILNAIRDERGTIVDFRWTYVNPMAGRILRRSPEELVGQRLLDVFPAHATKSDLFTRYVKVVETGQPHDCELQYDADGLQGWFRNMAVKLGDGVAVCFSDITDRKHAEIQQASLFAARQKSHEDLLSMLDQLRQGIIMTDSEGQITFANRGCRSLLGDRIESSYGRRWLELCPFAPEDRAALQAMARRAADERTRLRVSMRAAQDRSYVMEVDILDDPRNAGRLVWVFYDLTEIHDLRRLLDAQGTFHGMVGQSESMQSVYRKVQNLGAVDSTVLIEGETGTGKERVAQAIHAIGSRSGKLFLPVNCAGLTESLIGSQLFGHRRGAFTGAVADHLGVFETANGGTVFLDEIGDLPLNMQTNLLRVLQEKEVVRLGESVARKVDVRVIAATNQDLDLLVQQGRFRKDLLYRVRVARIILPPLRQRREDIPLLVQTFVAETRRRISKPVTAVSNEAMRRLLRHDWPGNVRELQNAVEMAGISCRGSVIRADDLPPELSTITPGSLSAAENGNQDAKTQVLTAIRAAGGSRTAAARLLGISRATLYRRLREFQLDAGSTA